MFPRPHIPSFVYRLYKSRQPMPRGGAVPVETLQTRVVYTFPARLGLLVELYCHQRDKLGEIGCSITATRPTAQSCKYEVGT